MKSVLITTKIILINSHALAHSSLKVDILVGVAISSGKQTDRVMISERVLSFILNHFTFSTYFSCPSGLSDIFGKGTEHTWVVPTPPELNI